VIKPVSHIYGHKKVKDKLTNSNRKLESQKKQLDDLEKLLGKLNEQEKPPRNPVPEQ